MMCWTWIDLNPTFIIPSTKLRDRCHFERNIFTCNEFEMKFKQSIFKRLWDIPEGIHVYNLCMQNFRKILFLYFHLVIISAQLGIFDSKHKKNAAIFPNKYKHVLEKTAWKLCFLLYTILSSTFTERINLCRYVPVYHRILVTKHLNTIFNFRNVASLEKYTHTYTIFICKFHMQPPPPPPPMLLAWTYYKRIIFGV